MKEIILSGRGKDPTVSDANEMFKNNSNFAR